VEGSCDNSKAAAGVALSDTDWRAI